MAKCRNPKCKGREIIWFENDNGYHPPVESIAETLPTSVVEALHSYREILALVDGRLIPVRASGLYVRHRCYNEPPEDEQLGRILGGRNNNEEYQETIDEVDCPHCEVEKGSPCTTPNGTIRRIPHLARAKYYAFTQEELSDAKG